MARDGSLRIKTAFGVLREQSPVAYQVIDGRRHRVTARFRLLGPRSYTFAVGRYRRDHALIIDPVISYARYLGGTGAAVDGDEVNDVALDSEGNVYATGATNSTDFSGADPGVTAYKGGAGDAFIAKLTPAETSSTPPTSALTPTTVDMPWPSTGRAMSCWWAARERSPQTSRRPAPRRSATGVSRPPRAPWAMTAS